MILVIRIAGMVEIPHTVQAALYHLRLRRKYSAVLIEDTPETRKLLQLVRSFVAYGPISKERLHQLITLRGQPINAKNTIHAQGVIEGMATQSLTELGLKPFFRLHPPRGGIETKKHFGVGKGVLGDNKEHINKLLEKML